MNSADPSPAPRLAALLMALLAGTVLAAPRTAPAHDFPTIDRVLYVNDCMHAHPGPFYEMANKCACALDRLADEVSYDDYVTMSTAVNANSIAGEAGNSIRDTPSLQKQIHRYRDLQAKVQKACFITH